MYINDNNEYWKGNWGSSNIQIEEHPCLLEEAFKREQTKPPHLRQRGFFICCTCPKCRRVFM